MIKSFYILLLCLVFSFAKAQKTNSHHAYHDFQTTLKKDLKFDSISVLFGDPYKDIGHGNNLYVYILNDSTEIWIGYTDHILFARHVSKKSVLDELFEDRELSYDYFKNNLKSDMNYYDVIKTFGMPEKDIGSGFYILLYPLSDSTGMVIGIGTNLAYAHYCDNEGNQLEKFK